MPNELLKDCVLVDEELDRQFHNPVPALSQATVQHLEECWRCRELHHCIVEKLEDVVPSPELQGRIQSALISSLTLVKPVPPIAVSVLGFLLVFTILALSLIGMTGRSGFHRMNEIQLIAMTTILALGVTLFSVSLAWQMIPGSYQRISIKRILTLSGVGLLAAVLLLFPWRTPEAFLAQGWPCSLTELAIAVPAAAVFWVLARRGAPISGPAMGSVLGGIAGLLAVTVLQFQCPHQEAPHLLVWHLGMLAVLVPTGMLIGHIVRNQRALQSAVHSEGQNPT